MGSWLVVATFSQFSLHPQVEVELESWGKRPSFSPAKLPSTSWDHFHIISTFAKTCRPPWSVQVCKRVCLRDQECRSVIEIHWVPLFSKHAEFPSFHMFPHVSTCFHIHFGFGTEINRDQQRSTEIPWDDLRWRQFSLAHDPRITWARATQRYPEEAGHDCHDTWRPAIPMLTPCWGRHCNNSTKRSATGPWRSCLAHGSGIESIYVSPKMAPWIHVSFPSLCLYYIEYRTIRQCTRFIIPWFIIPWFIVRY